jgi:hypothetical protein
MIKVRERDKERWHTRKERLLFFVVVFALLLVNGA